MSNPQIISDAVSETVKTDETVSISNQQFMEGMFGASPSARPFVVSFLGHPKKGTWSGRAWTGGKLLTPPHQNNYFSLSVYHPDADGKYKRRKNQFAGLHAVLLDDVGTKAPLDGLVATPSWLLETSPGNYQAGYLLAIPIEDAALAERLFQAFIDRGISDPGMNGPTVRLGRLPVGTNGKHDPSFPSRLISFDPTLRYTVEQLTTAFSLTLEQNIRKEKKAHPASRPTSSNDFGRSVLAALQDAGMYKQQQATGRHEITCPWVNEHTDGIDSGTMYFEPNDEYPAGGFKCQHGHCADRHLSELLKHLNIQGDGSARTTVLIKRGEIGVLIDKTQQILAKSKYYSRCGQIISLHVTPNSMTPLVRNATAADLLYALSHSANLMRWDAKAETEHPVDPPERLVKAMISLSHHAYLSELQRISCQPYLRNDFSLVTQPGFDKQSSTYGHFKPEEFAIPDRPTRLDARQALTALRELLEEFEFASPHDEAAALCAILTATIRPSLRLAPMFHVKAHTAGSGKSFLCELIMAFATPAPRCSATFSTDEKEFNKALVAELIKSPLVIEFDNLTCDLNPYPSLCTMLTAEYISGRILKESKIQEFPTRCLMLSSGNNVDPVGDMTRRCVTINLSPLCENPAQRIFKRPTLISDVMSNRAKYVSAVLTIIRAWLDDGRPTQPCHMIASFNDWTELCRQPLLWLEMPDPGQSVTEAISSDPEREEIDRFLTAWFAEFHSAPRRVRDAVSLCSQHTSGHQDLKECINSIAGERGDINARRLGRWMKRNHGRIVNGKRIARCNSRGSVEQWRVEAVATSPAVSTVSTVSTVSECSAADFLDSREEDINQA